MLTAILLQIASVLILALGAWLLNDATSALYVTLGAFTAIIPNALFALRLSLNRGKSPESYPIVFFLGEFLKVGLTLGLLMIVIRTANAHAEDVRWLALMVGLIVALKAPLFALALHRDINTKTNASSDVAAKSEADQPRKLPVRLGPYHPADAGGA